MLAGPGWGGPARAVGAEVGVQAGSSDNEGIPSPYPFPRLRLWAAWVFAVALIPASLIVGWHSFDNTFRKGQHRRDGNSGHVQIDFAGPWMLGRLLVEGHGRDLYDRRFQRDVLQRFYPASDQDPDEKQSDVEKLMDWLMGFDDGDAPAVVGSLLTPLAGHDPPGVAALLAAGRSRWTDDRLERVTAHQVGGALYPPVAAFLYAPVSLLPPRGAYHTFQVLSVLLLLVAAGAVWVIGRGRIWYPVAVLLLALFPGYLASVELAQNAVLTLTILLCGWALLSRGRPGWGGIVWGLLAFKPVWALAFFLVPVLTRRWRFCLGMAATGLCLAALTLPAVGVRGWLDWLEVGKAATEVYNTDSNWVHVSRDLLGVPRRWLLRFDRPAQEREPPWPLPESSPLGRWCRERFGLEEIPGWVVPSAAGWGLLLLVLGGTATVACLRWSQAQAPTGPAAAFLLLGAWLSCFHFMYYDVLLAAFPVCLLFVDAGRDLGPTRLVAAPLPVLHAAAPPGSPPWRWYRQTWRGNRLGPTLVVLVLLTQPLRPLLHEGSPLDQPWDTFCLLALWLWCGRQWLRRGKNDGEFSRRS
jgi:hypothetical protein